MLKIAAILAMSLVAVYATPFLPDEGPELAKRVEIVSSKDLNEFVEAWKSNDKEKLVEMIDFIVEYADYSEKYTDDLAGRYSRSLSYMASNTNFPPLLVTFARTLHGNRDSRAYYALETVIQWISKRQDAGVQEERLSTAVAALKESQAAGQILVDTFESTTGTLGRDASNAESVLKEAIQITIDKSRPFRRGAAKAHDTLRNLRETIEPYPEDWHSLLE